MASDTVEIRGCQVADRRIRDAHNW